MHNSTTAPELPTLVRSRDEQGMSTAEYAVGTVGACGFAGLLYKLLTSDLGQEIIRSIFERVLTNLPF